MRAACALAAGAILAGCGGSMEPPRNVSVTITGTDSTDVFTPARVTVRDGDTVVWTNSDDTPHQLISGDGGILFGSDSIARDAQYSFTFTTTGTIGYSCTLHPGSTGTIVVEPR